MIVGGRMPGDDNTRLWLIADRQETTRRLPSPWVDMNGPTGAAPVQYPDGITDRYRGSRRRYHNRQTTNGVILMRHQSRELPGWLRATRVVLSMLALTGAALGVALCLGPDRFTAGEWVAVAAVATAAAVLWVAPSLNARRVHSFTCRAALVFGVFIFPTAIWVGVDWLIHLGNYPRAVLWWIPGAFTALYVVSAVVCALTDPLDRMDRPGE